jgi:hypothetical protein
MMTIKISCREDNWKESLHDALRRQDAVELSDLDYTKDGAICEALAKRHSTSLVFFASDHCGYFNWPLADLTNKVPPKV